MFKKFKKMFVGLLVCILSLGIVSPVSGGLSAYAAASALWPLNAEYNTVTTYFDPSRNNGVASAHNAIDIPAAYYSDIYAPIDGVCVSAGWMGAYGNLIILWHEELGVYTFYAHCSAFDVVSGQNVTAGSVIGHVGNTGESYGNHLHFGICDTLMSGWPNATYYDPLTYFNYNTSGNKETGKDFEDTCGCTEDYAGVYVTKDVTSFLNLRSGHGSEFPVVGKLYPDSEFIVTKGDGTWAHVEYDGISGFCSMDYIQLSEKKTGMTIADERIPDGQIVIENTFKVGGVISSNLPIARVTGGIYAADAATPIYTYESSPNKLSYDLSAEFDSKLLFNKLQAGTYVYRIEAEDISGEIYCLIGKSFMVIKSGDSLSDGDLNGDGNINIADAVILQKYILGMELLTDEQMKYADLTGDSRVDVFDMVMLRKLIVK